MKPPTSTIVIDLAALGVLRDGPSSPQALCRHVQAICRPWITPTACVICDRLIAWMEQGVVAEAPGGEVALTPAGRERLTTLLTLPAVDQCHGLLPLLETLKLALADQLDRRQRQALLHELVQLRARCLRAQEDADPAAPELLQRCAARRRLAASLAEQALAQAIARYDTVEQDP